MDNMYAHIEELCRLKGVSITQMCRDLGITRSALSELKNGRTQRLSIKYTKLILEYFNVDMFVFERPIEEIEGTIENNEKDNKKSEFNKLFDKLTPEEQQLITDQMTGLIALRTKK